MGDSHALGVVPIRHEPEAVWQTTIARVVPSVVSIKFAQPFSFDTSLSRTSQATGFIVDAARGYVLTNRHVVGTGPFWGHIIFHNHEEADVYPLYRDPIHDFGILRFDPKAVKYLKLAALDLEPNLAQVGVEIKVIGNDAGETLSIHSGFISRTDRNTPDYKSYRDFNTCYYQASAGATGGSSGSPVVDVSGQAIAMQAGGRTDRASTDYFLPLDAPLRALQLIQRGVHPARGDIQCKFLLKPFDRCRRLGLSSSWESHIRDTWPEQTSMLVAQAIIPGGPSDKKIKEGDILLKANGQLITSFVLLENMLNGSIGCTVRFLLHRGGSDVEEDVMVGDLDDITPKRNLSVAGGTFHDLSYQVAQRYNIPCSGVYVSSGGSWTFTKSCGSIIRRVATRDTPDLETFMEVMKAIPDRDRIMVSYTDLTDLHTLHTEVFHVNRHWSSKMKMATRNDATGVWDVEILAGALPPKPLVPSKASFALPKDVPPSINNAMRSFVKIWTGHPFLLDGLGSKRFSGMGLVVDADQGLVLASRTVVHHRLCDVRVTIASSIVVEGRVVFLHPSQNYAIVQYDPSLVDAPVHTANLCDENLAQGDQVTFVGHTTASKMVYASTTVTRRNPLRVMPLSVPQYRPINIDHITIESTLGGLCSDGILMADNGDVKAVWLNSERENGHYAYGQSTADLLPVISRIRQGSSPSLRVLPVEFEPVTMFKARVFGVPTTWIDRVEEKEAPHQLFAAKRVFGGQEGQLVEGDVLLTLNGELITESSQLDVTYWNELINAEIFRNGEQTGVQLRTLVAEDMETNHFVQICGLTLQKPHLAVRQQIKELPSEVYITGRYVGSPAALYGLGPTNFITEINDVQTLSLDTILDVVRQIPDNTYFRIRGVSSRAVPFVTTIKKNEHYFPTSEWLKDDSAPGGWSRRTYEGDMVVEGEPRAGIVA